MAFLTRLVSFKLICGHAFTQSRTALTCKQTLGEKFRTVFTSKPPKLLLKTTVKRWNKVLGILAFSAVPIGVGTSAVLVAKQHTLIGHCERARELPHLVEPVIETQCEQPEHELGFDWAKLFELAKPDILYISAAVLSALIVAGLNIYIPAMLGDIVNTVSKLLVENTVGVNFLQEIKDPASRLVLLYIAQSIFTFAYISALSHSGECLASRIRQQLFASILKQDVSFFDTHKTGEIVSRLTADVQEFKSSFKLCISQGLRSFTQSLGCVISLYVISPKLTGILLLVLPSIVFVGTAIGSVLRKMSQAAQAQMSRAVAKANEAIGNIRTVRSFAMEDHEIELYSKELAAAEELQIQLGIGIGAFQGLANLALNGIVLGVLCLGGHLLTSKEISPGSLMAFLVASQTIQRSLAQVSLLFGHYVRGLSAGSRVFQFINMEPSVQLKGGLKIGQEELRGELFFDKVTFSYPTRQESIVLKDFSFHLPPGKIVALCGLSGGGKSTVAALIERFYDVEPGTIYLDDVDIQNLDPSWLRGKVIGFINQEPVLFATTIMENIRYGHPEASDEEVRRAAKLANADSFIGSFPLGYQTVLGERGVTVSGGQKQRIAIARALLKDPAVLILDEATSALDTESEKLVQEALDRVAKGRTVLIIAHRLSTIQNADIIAVIANGKIAEIGNHQSLQQLKGLYWQMTRHQENEKLFEDVPK